MQRVVLVKRISELGTAVKVSQNLIFGFVTIIWDMTVQNILKMQLSVNSWDDPFNVKIYTLHGYFQRMYFPLSWAAQWRGCRRWGWRWAVPQIQIWRSRMWMRPINRKNRYKCVDNQFSGSVTFRYWSGSSVPIPYLSSGCGFGSVTKSAVTFRMQKIYFFIFIMFYKWNLKASKL